MATATAPCQVEKPSSRRKVKDQPLFIGGKWVDSVSGKTFETLNPATGEVIARSPRATRPTSTRPSRPPARRSRTGRGRR